MRVERFMLSHGMRELIAAFDQGKPIPKRAGFVLLPPNASTKLDYIKNISKECRERRLAGLTKSNALAGTRRTPDPRQHLVRSGSGRVQFVHDSKEGAK
jgi:hypothetical protein